MAEVVVPGHHANSHSIGNMASTAPTIEMLPNPDFAFPRTDSSTSHTSHRRPKSMNMSAARPRTAEHPHRRGVSALPSFNFNASDVSGLTGDETQEAEEAEEAEAAAQTTPSRGVHKRNTSEFVGGMGVTGAISTSPTRSDALSIPPRQHRSRHSRSQLTLSSHDLSSIMSPPEPQPRLSSSLPNTPLERPTQVATPVTFTQPEGEYLFGPLLEDVPARPPSRPRVEFSDNVEYIPRPLSTISSETESSMSTVRGHSVNNSISSVLSLSTPSPPSARARAISLETTLEDEPRLAPRSSLEISRRIEKEGQWLKTGTLGADLDRPLSEPASQPPKLTFAVDENLAPKPRTSHKKKQSLSHALGFDRRRSEPTIGMHTGVPSRLSALSLQEQAIVAPYAFEPLPLEVDHRSSSRKLKDWAVSKLSRKSKEWPQAGSGHFAIPSKMPGTDASPESEPAAAETDLDAVFSLDSDEGSESVRTQPVFDVTDPFFNPTPGSGFDDHDESGTMLDLDAALGPFNTPSLVSQRPRRELHSSRGTKDFVGPGGHYLPSPIHRRTESAPMLTPFDQLRTGTPPQAAMADVFEEDEEESDCSWPTRRASTQSMQDDEASMGVEIVDSDMSANSSTPSLGLNDGLRIRHGEWEPERPNTSYGNLTSRLAAPILDRRSSIIEDTIIEEPSPVEPAIVEAHEEPRAQSLTKSSDSSETPTILASQSEMLGLPDSQTFLTTPESSQSSAFSSPDFPRRQSSFDTSRVGTSASSMTDNRTMSSCTTGEPPHEMRISVDDVPSLTSSRSTMISTMYPNTSRRDVSGTRTPSTTCGTFNAAVASERRRKRASIQSLSQLVGGSFGPRLTGSDGGRPQTATDSGMGDNTPKKEHRLKKLMFWKSKNRQASSSTIL